MLINTTTLEPNIIEHFRRYGFEAPIAEDPETGARLRTGYGRQRTGRARRYYVTVPRSHLPAGLFDQEPIGTVRAFSDEDAIVKANSLLRRRCNV